MKKDDQEEKVEEVKMDEKKEEGGRDVHYVINARQNFQV